MSTKNGCLFMLLAWGGSAYFFWTRLDPQLEARIWIAIGLGLAVTLVLGQILALLTSIKKLAVSGKSVETWKDGELVGISGAIRPKGFAITAPASGTQAVIVEYELERRVRRKTSKGSETSYTKDISGFLMAPCGIQTKRGMVRLHGFPMMNHFSSKHYSDPAHFERMSEYLANTTYEPVTANPMKAIKELSAVYSDEDGDVLKNFVHSHSLVRPDEWLQAAQVEDIDTEGDSERQNSIKERLLQDLSMNSYHVTEKIVPVGMEVTAFGTYNERAKAVDIGSGLKFATHSLQPGELSAVARKGVIKSIFGLIFWSAVALTATYFALPEVKSFVDQQLLQKYLSEFIPKQAD